MIWGPRERRSFGRLAAIRAGGGPAVVLLHGVGLRAEAWNAQIDDLAKHYEVIAPDMAGHGASPRIAPPASLNGFADLVAEAIGELGAPVRIAGHSMGAMLALNVATRHPALITGVAALNAIFRRTPEAAAAVRKRADGLDGKTPGDPAGPLARWFGGNKSDETDACREWLTTVDPDGYRDAYTVFARADGPTDDSLRTMTCPALFLTGEDEPNSTPAMSEAMAELAPNGRCVILKNAAHMMPMTHPREVNSVLRDFFADAHG